MSFRFSQANRQHVLVCLCLALSIVSLPMAPANAQWSTLNISSKEKITLRFRDVEIDEVLAAFGQSMGKSFVLDSRVKGKITLESPTPVTVSRAYAMLAAGLGLQGYSLIEQGDLVRVLPSADAKSAGVPFIGDGVVTSRQGLVTKSFSLQHESAAQVLDAVRALVPASNPVTAIPQSNMLLVTDTAENLRNIERIIASIDKPRDGFVRRYEARHAIAGDIAVMVDRLVNSGQVRGSGDYAHQRITLMPAGRTNTLIIHGLDQSRVNFAYSVAEQMDLPSRKSANIHVVYLKHADATSLATTLQSLFRVNPQNQKTASDSKSGVSTASTTPLQSLSDPPPQDGVIVRAEPGLNALIIVAPEPLFVQMREVINELDLRRAQVYIESLIVEVSNDRAAEFGVQFQYLDGLNSSGTSAFGGSNFASRSGAGSLLDVIRNPLATGLGLNVGVIRGTVSVPFVDASGVSRIANVANLGLLARALETQGVGNVIATPNLLTLDNEEARIIIGQNVPFVTGNYTLNTGANQTPFQTIERKDVGTTLRVKPTVIEGGAIRLQIFQEVSSVVPASVATLDLAASQGLTTNRRAIESTVIVDDEQIIVIGGLIEDREQISKNKVPLLGDIPLLGALFRYDSSSRVKTNLMVFLRPVILRDANDANILSSDRYQSIRRVQTELPRDGGWLPDLGRKILEQQGPSPIKPNNAGGPSNPDYRGSSTP